MKAVRVVKEVGCSCDNCFVVAKNDRETVDIPDNLKSRPRPVYWTNPSELGRDDYANVVIYQGEFYAVIED